MKFPLRPSVLKTAGVAGALLGVAAVGATAGMVAERYALHRLRRRRDDLFADEPFAELVADETRAVITSDGVPLYAEIVEPPDGRPASLTVLFVHGFCLDMGAWHFQRRALSASIDPRCRLLFFDLPGHGRSGTRASGEYTLDQLADDIATVINEIAPDGPLVLLGHSMGGMALMALAEHDPQLFADRVVGIGLFSTSAGHLDEVTLGMPSAMTRFRKPLMPTISGALKAHPGWLERGRMPGSDVTYLLTRRYGFGSRNPSQAMVEYVARMNSSTAVEVIAGYLGTLSEHDRYDALGIFAGIKTLVVCGDKDLITPVAHTREIARLLPHADLVEVPDGGHLTMMEHADAVNEYVLALIRRVGG